MELEVLGWPPDGPTLRLDHERFAYAGKFVMSDTGKAAGRADDELVAAASFSPDRTDSSVLRIRYITVRTDRRGEGLGPELASFVAAQAEDRGYGTVKIAVNNPFAYEAMHRAGFEFTGKETGLAELVLARPCERPAADERAAAGDRADAGERADADERAAAGDRADATYRDGLRRFADRDLGEAERAFLAERLDADAPDDARRDP